MKANVKHQKYGNSSIPYVIIKNERVALDAVIINTFVDHYQVLEIDDEKVEIRHDFDRLHYPPPIAAVMHYNDK